ncbi:MAG: TIGR03435 family protein [Terracidiphilus sp.]
MAAWIAGAAPAVYAQAGETSSGSSKSVTTKLPEFEVATIKLSDIKHSGKVGPYTYPGGKVEVGFASLKSLVQFAFDVSSYQVTVPEKWMSETLYDITAIPPDDSPARKLNPPSIAMPMNAEQCQMLRSLLINRFGLKYHIESREGPVYFLEKSKGGLTKAVKPTDPKDKGNVPKMIVVIYGGSDVTEQYPLYGRNTTMAYTAHRLSQYLHSPVIDRTGIEGVFDFDIPGTNDLETDISTAIFGEVKELGLTLKAGKGSVQTIVVDSATTPTEN